MTEISQPLRASEGRMSDKKQTVPPELLKAKRVLDEVMAIQPSYGPGEFPPSEEECAAKAKQVYHERMMRIYLALANTAMEARSERP